MPTSNPPQLYHNPLTWRSNWPLILPPKRVISMELDQWILCQKLRNSEIKIHLSQNLLAEAINFRYSQKLYGRWLSNYLQFQNLKFAFAWKQSSVASCALRCGSGLIFMSTNFVFFLPLNLFYPLQIVKGRPLLWKMATQTKVSTSRRCVAVSRSPKTLVHQITLARRNDFGIDKSLLSIQVSHRTKFHQNISTTSPFLSFFAGMTTSTTLSTLSPAARFVYKLFFPRSPPKSFKLTS